MQVDGLWDLMTSAMKLVPLVLYGLGFPWPVPIKDWTPWHPILSYYPKGQRTPQHYTLSIANNGLQ